MSTAIDRTKAVTGASRAARLQRLSLARVPNGWLCTALVLLAALPVFIYVDYVNGNYVSRDQWQFLPLVEKSFAGGVSFRDFWRSHTEHVKPGYLLIFVANAHVLDLDVRKELFIGILLLTILTWSVGRWFLGSLPRRTNLWLAVAGLAALSALLLGFNQWASFVFSLLALGGFAGLALTMLVFRATDLALRSAGRRHVAQAGVLLAAAIVTFVGARGPAVLAAASVAVAFHAALEQRWRPRHSLVAASLITCGAGSLAAYLTLHSGPEASSSLLQGLLSMMQEPLRALNGFLLEMGSSLLISPQLAPSLLPYESTVPAGLLLTALYLAATWLFIHLRLHQRTVLPIAMIAYSSGLLVSIVAGRFDSYDFERIAGTPRYAFDLQIGLAGVLWVFVLAAAEKASGRRWRLPAYGVIAIVLAGTANNAWMISRFAPYQRLASDNAIRQILAAGEDPANSDEMAAWLCPGKRLCAQGVDILKRRELNVFARTASAPE